jgi:hypothetical protein
MLLVAYSRRLYVHTFRSQRHDDWREGLAGALLIKGERYRLKAKKTAGLLGREPTKSRP